MPYWPLLPRMGLLDRVLHRVDTIPSRASSREMVALRAESEQLTQGVAELELKNRVLKKSVLGSR